MGGSVSSKKGSGSGYGGHHPEQCCDHVVDPVSLLATLGAIAALSLFLRQAVIDFMIMMGRRKRSSGSGREVFFEEGIFLQGRQPAYVSKVQIPEFWSIY